MQKTERSSEKKTFIDKKFVPETIRYFCIFYLILQATPFGR